MVGVFVKIDGIKGTGTGAHRGWLKAENFAVKPSRNSQLIRFQDAASPSLFRFYANNARIPTMTVDVVRAGAIVWRAELSDVVISNVQVSPIPLPWESLALRFVGISIRTLSGAGLRAAAAPGDGLAARDWTF